MLEKEPDLEIIAECADGLIAVDAIRSEVPDLLFLDISMPGLDGFGVLDALGSGHQPRVVVFVTAYDEHAVRAFEACALDYLVKPPSPERLARAVNRAREQLVLASEQEANQAAPTVSAGAAPSAQRFAVRSGNRMTFVSAAEIDWVEAAGNYMILHVGTANHMIRETMSGMEEKLPADTFMRVSRSAMINLPRLKELQTSSNGDTAAILKDGQRVHVTRPLREVAERVAST
jgi:two-component system LytT family response regulator